MKLLFVYQNFPGQFIHVSSNLIQLMQVSSAHVSRTYPFVLSWSMLEALSAGTLVIGSKTGPVQEVIEDGHNSVLAGLLGSGSSSIAATSITSPRGAGERRHEG